MATKLYKASVEFVYYFMAEEGKQQSEAESCIDDAFRDDSLITPDVQEVTEYQDLTDWDDHGECLVYGTKKDTTLVEAFELGTGKNYEDDKMRSIEEWKARFAKATGQ